MPIYGITIYQEEFKCMPIFGKLGRLEDIYYSDAALVNTVPIS